MKTHVQGCDTKPVGTYPRETSLVPQREDLKQLHQVHWLLGEMPEMKRKEKLELQFLLLLEYPDIKMSNHRLVICQFYKEEISATYRI